MINEISGNPTEMKHVQAGDEEISTAVDIADMLAESFFEMSYTTNYTTKFQSHKASL